MVTSVTACTGYGNMKCGLAASLHTWLWLVLFGFLRSSGRFRGQEASGVAVRVPQLPLRLMSEESVEDVRLVVLVVLLELPVPRVPLPPVRRRQMTSPTIAPKFACVFWAASRKMAMVVIPKYVPPEWWFG